MDSVQPAETSKTTFELVVLGAPTLRDSFGQIPVGLGSGKPLALLCFLVVRAEARRDEALALLWDDVDEDRARNAFRQALHRLRLAVGEDLVVGDRQLLRIGSSDRLRSDVAEFEKAIDEDRLGDALALYQADFLEGFDVGSRAFDEWAQSERLRLRSRCKSAAERATQRALVDGKMDVAETAVRKLLAVAPMDARAIEIAASAFVSMGRRAQAVEVLEAFERRTRDEGTPLPRSAQAMLDRLSESDNRPEIGEKPRDNAFVGRGAEYARLLAAWHSIGEESGATVVIEGPTGAGKSRLLHEFTDGVRALGVAHMLHGVEGPRGFTAPYAAVSTALRPLVRAPGVAGASPHLLAEAARLLPELRDAFQLPPVEPAQEDTARLRMCEGIAALLEAAAYERPICLTVDDVHRASGSTLELLGYLASRLRRTRVALVLTFNADDVSREAAGRLRSLAGGPLRDAHGPSADAHRIQLSPLSLTETTDLVAQVLGQSAARETAQRVAERADGNPLRAVELARLTLEGVEPTSLPVRTSDIVRDRIRSCSANERRLLLAACLLARPATIRLLADASHVGASAADDASQGLKRRGLMTEIGSSVAPASETVVEASVELAGEATTVFVAGWVAESLMRDPHAEPGEVARLFAVAGRVAETHEWARRAGGHSLARGATEEALYFLRVAREFARSGSEHAAVEGLLAALGAGRVQLPSAGSAKPPRGQRARVATFVSQHFPNWRYLAGAAIATSLIAIALTAWVPRPALTAIATRDTLIVAGAQDARRGLVRQVTSGQTGIDVSGAVPRSASRPAWVDSIDLPWVNAIASPNGRYVGLERITPGGSNVYLIAADRRDTIPLVVGDAEAFAMGWSPDAEMFLATRRRNVGDDYQFGLFAFPVSRPREPIAIDTSANHSVAEAGWSPDGALVGWVARVPGGQEEVFVSWADGSHRRNISAHPAQDYHIAWSADGSLLAFTSRRDGNAEIYAYDLLNERLWRVTQDDAQDDRAAFDADGRLVAFESTRGGAPNVYLMPSLGGAVTRVGDSTSSYEIVGWRRSATKYLDRLELGVPPTSQRDDTVTLHVRGLDQFGAPMLLWHAQWTVVDSSMLRPLQVDAGASPLEHRFVALRDGLARVAVSVGAWRTDTAYVKIGDGPVTLLRDDFGGASLLRTWRSLGQPLPSLGSVPEDNQALVINADRQWESGVLSLASIPIRAGMALEATLHAPFDMHASATTATIALVAADPPDAIDIVAPRFLRLISVTWNADAQRFVYAAERDVFVEAIPPAPAGARGGSRALGVLVNQDGTVTFLVDGVPRWTSTARVLRNDRTVRAQLWLSGQDTGARIAFGRVNASLRNPR